MSATHTAHCDVLIVGGGLAGACFACAMSRYCVTDTDWRVMVFDRSKAQNSPLDFANDLPSTALSMNSIRILSELGVWQDLQAYSAPVRSVHVRHDKRNSAHGKELVLHTADSYLSYGHSHTHETKVLGAVVETPRLLSALIAKTRQNNRILWHAQTQVSKACANSAGGFDIYSGQDCYSTDLLAVADGPYSALREHLGIDTEQRDYATSALLLNVSTKGIEADAAYELFLAEGSMALLPMPSQDGNTRALLVRVAPHASTETMMAMSDKALLEHLQQTLAIKGASLYMAGTRRTRPMAMIWSKEQYRRGLVLLGDAAHALHPIAAQGFNLALADIEVLVRTLVLARQHQQSTGDIGVLASYLRARNNAQRNARTISDGLARFFAGQHPLKTLASDTGFASMRYITPLRRYFTRRTMGLI